MGPHLTSVGDVSAVLEHERRSHATAHIGTKWDPVPHDPDTFGDAEVYNVVAGGARIGRRRRNVPGRTTASVQP